MQTLVFLYPANAERAREKFSLPHKRVDYYLGRMPRVYKMYIDEHK